MDARFKETAEFFFPVSYFCVEDALMLRTMSKCKKCNQSPGSFLSASRSSLQLLFPLLLIRALAISAAPSYDTDSDDLIVELDRPGEQ